jgi:hypothetical protein
MSSTVQPRFVCQPNYRFWRGRLKNIPAIIISYPPIFRSGCRRGLPFLKPRKKMYPD